MTIASSLESAVQSGLLLASSREAILNLYQSTELESWAKLSIEELVEGEKWTELNDRFYTNLKFGTGGIRGRTICKTVTQAEKGTPTPLGAPEHAGVGTNVMNDANIRFAALGLGEYLLKNFPNQKSKVVIAHDTRHFSRHFAELLAECVQSQGHEAYLFSDSRSTPQLSFSVRWLKAQAGVVISASHNPWHDNGFKCYFEDGAQVVEPQASGIIAEVNRLKEGASSTCSLEKGRLHLLGEEADQAYLQALESLVLEPETIQKAKSSLKIVFTSLHGTGIQIIPRLLKKFGFQLHIVPEQEKGDGRFPTVQSPNPENAEALAIAIAQAKELKADIVIATDPDCDRMGVAIRNDQGEYEIVSGNIIGTLMADYRIRRFFAQGILNEKNKSHGVLIKTFVTTDLQKSMAEKQGLKCIETLTGFKYIGEKLRNYEQEAGLAGRDSLSATERRGILLEKSSFFIFGGEESYGYSGGDYVRDKDANAAALMFAEAAAEAKIQGRTLLDCLNQIYQEYGFYTEKLGALTFEGAVGAAQIKRLLESYRTNPPQSYQGKKVVQIQDFEKEIYKDLDGKVIPKEMMLIFHMEDGCRMAVRGSGTEPKIKFYFFAKAAVKGDLNAVKESCKLSLDSWWNEVQEDIKKRVGSSATTVEMNLEQLKSWGIQPLRSGKVRDLYTYQEELWIVASDRISAFDVILPNLIPNKGVLLTQIARQWFDRTSHLIPNHVISYDLPAGIEIPEWKGRLVRAKKTEVIPVECVARGYLAGSGWKEYQESGTCGGFPLPKGLLESSELPRILFTPATKAETGHDENLTEAQARDQIGDLLYETLQNLTLTLYRSAKEIASKRGIIIADTKFEFGWLDGKIILIDEILTPDSSRFWPAEHYQPGKSQPSFDKQILRNYLETVDWDKQPPGPVLPEAIIQKIQAKYQEVFDLLKS